MHHKGFVKRLFVVLTFNVDQRSLGQRRQHFVGRLRFEDHFSHNTLAAHTTFTLVDRMKMGVRHPGGIEVDRGDIQRLFDPVGVVEQAIIG